MSTDFVIHLMREAIGLAAAIGLPILVSALVIGVTISLIQAITQIQEMTLTFVPKVIVIGLVIYLLGPWILNRLITFSTHVFNELLLVQ